MQKLKALEESHVLGIEIAGEIDSGSADDFFEQFLALYQTPSDVVFHCAKVEFIDSTALGTFVKINKRVKADGFHVKITGLLPRLKKLFVICSLDTIMEIE